jgi:hypothetical protein
MYLFGTEVTLMVFGECKVFRTVCLQVTTDSKLWAIRYSVMLLKFLNMQCHRVTMVLSSDGFSAKM